VPGELLLSDEPVVLGPQTGQELIVRNTGCALSCARWWCSAARVSAVAAAKVSSPSTGMVSRYWPTLLLDGADPALAGPAGTGGARAIGTLAVVGKGVDKPPEDAGEQPGLRWAYFRARVPRLVAARPRRQSRRRCPAPRPLHRVSVTLTVDGMGRSPNTYARYSVFRKVNRSIHRPESEATSFPR
jgi:hypothetical protein